MLIYSLYAGLSHSLPSALLPTVEVKNVFPRSHSVGNSDLKSQAGDSAILISNVSA